MINSIYVKEKDKYFYDFEFNEVNLSFLNILIFRILFLMKTSKQMISAIDTAAPKSFSASIVKITRVLSLSLTACIKVISRLILKSEASILRKMLLSLNELSSKTIAFNK